VYVGVVVVVVVGGGVGAGVLCVVVVAGALGIGALVAYGSGVGAAGVVLGCIGWAAATLDAVTACQRPPKLSIPWPRASSRP